MHVRCCALAGDDDILVARQQSLPNKIRDIASKPQAASHQLARASTTSPERLIDSDTLSPSPAADSTQVPRTSTHSAVTQRARPAAGRSAQNGAIESQYSVQGLYKSAPRLSSGIFSIPDMVVAVLTTIGCFDQARSYPRSLCR